MFVREITESEYWLLTDFLYEAIYQKEGESRLPRTVLQKKGIIEYIENFGEVSGDLCVVCVTDGLIVGAAWCRYIKSYGYISDDYPELAVSVYPEYRRKGIGKALICGLLNIMSERGYKGISLSVDNENFAADIYRKIGFAVIDENANDTKMLLIFDN